MATATDRLESLEAAIRWIAPDVSDADILDDARWAVAEIERIRAALVEERAARLHYRGLAEVAYGIDRGAEWHEEAISRDPVTRASVERYRAQARAELIAEGLLPPA